MKFLYILPLLLFCNISFSQVLTASFTAPDTACKGSIITFTNTSSGGTAPLSYIWNFGNQEVLNNVQNPTYAFPSEGNFIVTLVTTDANGFSASTSQLIKILAPPFTVISSLLGQDYGCSPHLVTFLNLTVQPPSYNPMNHFDWSFTDGSPTITTLSVPMTQPATPQTSIQHTFIGQGVSFDSIIGLGYYTATLTAYNDFGCSSFATKEIYIIPLPIATAGGSQSICSNSSATVSGASSLNGTIFWTHSGEGNITNGQGTLSPTYTSVIEDAGNTVTLTMTVSSTYTLACSPPAIATYTIFVNPSSINTTTATACDSYTWNGQTYTSSGVYTGTTANCITESLNLTIPTLPTQNICVVGLDSLTNNIRLVWEKPLTTAIDSFYIYKESNVADVYSQIGSRAYDSLSIWIDPISNPAVQSYRYKITAFDTCGVETPLSDYHKTMHLTINQGVGGAWNLIWSHYEGINFSSYRIYRGTSLSNMALLTTIQSNLNSYTDLNPPTGLVYYQIEIINPNNCSPTKSINYSSSKSNITSISQNDLLVITSDYISIFPNPTTSIITVTSSAALIGSKLIIYDQLGKEVMSGFIIAENTEVDMSRLAEGVYLFKAGTDMQETFRIIKQ